MLGIMEEPVQWESAVEQQMEASNELDNKIDSLEGEMEEQAKPTGVLDLGAMSGVVAM